MSELKEFTLYLVGVRGSEPWELMRIKPPHLPTGFDVYSSKETAIENMEAGEPLFEAKCKLIGEAVLEIKEVKETQE